LIQNQYIKTFGVFQIIATCSQCKICHHKSNRNNWAEISKQYAPGRVRDGCS